jgi:nucleoside-diphosphate-sugar epimerase
MPSLTLVSSNEKSHGNGALLENCLVTGGTGFVGRHLVQNLEVRGEAVTLLCRANTNGHKAILGDLTAGNLDLSGQSFTTVYHVAGFAHVVPRTQAEREMFFHVNVEGTRNLLKHLEQGERLPESFVLVSSVSVYGREEGELLDETTARDAVDPYGVSKCQAEDTVLEWGMVHGVRIGIVRLPLVVGSGAPGNLKLMINALKGRRYCGVGSGAARRSMVLVADVSRILPAIAKLGGTFNLTDGYHPSFLELEEALCDALGRRPPFRLPLGAVKTAGRAGDALNSVLNLSLPITSAAARKMSSTLTFSDARARRTLGWRPESVLDNIADIVN